MTFAKVFAVVIVCLATFARAETECEARCRYIRNDMNSHRSGACANERRALPRPKLGNACMAGFNAGFDDSCVLMCEGGEPRKDQGKACKPYRTEMPKPTTMRSCGTGYGKGFDFGKIEGAGGSKEDEKVDLKATLKPPPKPEDKKASAPKTMDAAPEAPTEEAPTEEAPTETEEAPAAAVETEEIATEEENTAPEEPAEAAEPIFQMPVTVDDSEVPLKIFAAEDPEEVVIAFCAEHMADAGDSCTRQLLPHVLQKMEEFEDSIAGIPSDAAEE